MEKIANFINGKLQEPVSGNYLNNINPALGEAYALTPDSDENDLKAALEAAQAALEGWSNSSIQKRAEVLMTIADKITENLEWLAKAESVDNGKPLSLAKTVDIPRAADNMRFFAHAITQFSSESHSMEDSAINYTLRSPLGVVACISPWNLPLYLFTWKIAPALAAGNCVIGKPSEITPMSAYLFSKICIEAGLPPGVLNILHGTGAKIGSALISAPSVKGVSFTGGTNTGAQIASVAAPQFKKLSLELGGKNPALIFADCDWESTLEKTLMLAFRNQGQICLCGSRLLIERSIYEKFRDQLVAKTEALKLGDPMDKTTEQGALVSREHMEKVLSYIKLAQDEGGTVLTGGHQVQLEGRCKNGFFVKPTIIEGLSGQCRTNQEEIFGPVVTLTPFDSEEEAVQLANGTRYGLAATLWSNNVKRCHRVASQLEHGIVWVNTWMLRDLRTPFGGTKNSGVGREGGVDALRFFTESKNVCVYHGE